MHIKDGEVSSFSYGMGMLFTYGYGVMEFVEKTLKSDDYQQILKDSLLHTIKEQYPEANTIFSKIWRHTINRKVLKNG